MLETDTSVFQFFKCLNFFCTAPAVKRLSQDTSIPVPEKKLFQILVKLALPEINCINYDRIESDLEIDLWPEYA